MNEIVQEAYPAQMAIADLLPTQVTVGMREVDIKRMRWRERSIDQSYALPRHSSRSGRCWARQPALHDRSTSSDIGLVCGGHC